MIGFDSWKIHSKLPFGFFSKVIGEIGKRKNLNTSLFYFLIIFN